MKIPDEARGFIFGKTLHVEGCECFFELPRQRKIPKITSKDVIVCQFCLKTNHHLRQCNERIKLRDKESYENRRLAKARKWTPKKKDAEWAKRVKKMHKSGRA